MGSVVRFRGPGAGELRGKITGIRTWKADVWGEDGSEWSVPYAAITEVESAPAIELYAGRRGRNRAALDG